MKNKDDISRQEAELGLGQVNTCKDLEVEMTGASALMEAEMLLDSKNSDYVLGFLRGYAHCLQLGERFDAISRKR
jgi:hypothetical protein